MASHSARSSAGPPDVHPALPIGVRPTFSNSLPASADSVGRLRRAVAAFARRHGATDHSLESVSIAVSEAVTNAVLHAYRDAAEPGPVLVVATMEDQMLHVTVADEGCGMTPRYDSPGLGHGMAIMAMLTDTFEVASLPAGRSGVVLRMRFELAGQRIH
jgi:serine/threonine-protein kinase RsbW